MYAYICTHTCSVSLCFSRLPVFCTMPMKSINHRVTVDRPDMLAGAAVVLAMLITGRDTRSSYGMGCMPLADLWQQDARPNKGQLYSLRGKLAFQGQRLQVSRARSAVQRGLAESVSAIAFQQSYNSFNQHAQRRGVRALVMDTGDGTQATSNHSIDQRRLIEARRHRGVYSHVDAQEMALLDILGASKFQHLILQATCDDVSTWMRITAATKPNILAIGRKRDKLLVVTMLGMLQKPYLRERASDRLRCIDICVPGQLLPKANASTLRERIARWVLLSGTGVGSHLISRLEWGIFKRSSSGAGIYIST